MKLFTVISTLLVAGSALAAPGTPLRAERSRKRDDVGNGNGNGNGNGHGRGGGHGHQMVWSNKPSGSDPTNSKTDLHLLNI